MGVAGWPWHNMVFVVWAVCHTSGVAVERRGEPQIQLVLPYSVAMFSQSSCSPALEHVLKYAFLDQSASYRQTGRRFRTDRSRMALGRFLDTSSVRWRGFVLDVAVVV
ncbi:hypothetical protein AKJ16_DCAP27074 [Drosera capensis]